MDSRSIYESLKTPKEAEPNFIEKLLSDAKLTATALLAIKYDILENTEADVSYSLQSLSYLLVNQSSAWSIIERPLIDALVRIVSTFETVQVQCPALSILTTITIAALRVQSGGTPAAVMEVEGAIINNPAFLEALLAAMCSGNVKVVTYSLQLICALIISFVLPENKTPEIYARLRQAGLFRAISLVIDNKGVTSSNRQNLYDLQELLKACIKKTKQYDESDWQKVWIQSADKHLAAFIGRNENSISSDWTGAGVPPGERAQDIINQRVKTAGLLDFIDLLSSQHINFKKRYLEQTAFIEGSARFPLLQSSLAITEIIYKKVFGIDSSVLSPSLLDGTADTLVPAPFIISGHARSASESVTSNGSTSNGNGIQANGNGMDTSYNSSSVENIINKLDNLRPMFFEWTSLHTNGLTNFMRIWATSKAQVHDLDNLVQVMTVMFETVAKPLAESTSFNAFDQVSKKMDAMSYDEIRNIQMQSIDNLIATRWSPYIEKLEKAYLTESQQFVQEQRLRLLLDGDWFFVDDPTLTNAIHPPPGMIAGSRNGGRSMSTVSQQTHSSSDTAVSSASSSSNGGAGTGGKRFFICLSPSRKTLQYSQFPHQLETNPTPELLTRSIDLSLVSKITITPITHAVPSNPQGLKRVSLSSRINYTKISLIGAGGGRRDGATLSFYSDTPEKAASWGDGLLMLKSKQYQSPDTKKYIDTFSEAMLKMQMLNFSPAELKAPSPPPLKDIIASTGSMSDKFYYQ